MTRTFAATALALCFATSATAMPIEARVGVTAPAMLHNRNEIVDEENGGVTTRSSLLLTGAQVFFEIPYAGLHVAYHTSVGQDRVNRDNGTDRSESYMNRRSTYLVTGIEAKYPLFRSRGAAFAPALGLSYWLNLSYNDASTQEEKSDMSDRRQFQLNELFLSLGGDYDIDIYRTLSARVGVDFGINLLAGDPDARREARANGAEYRTAGFIIGINAGIVFRL